MSRFSTPTVTAQGGMLALSTPYNPGLVAELKAKIPPQDRAWDAAGRVWLVSPTHGSIIANLITQYYQLCVDIPVITATPQSELRLLEVRYLGTSKSRDGWEASAFGWDGSKWAYVFPETTLREWFDAGQAMPDEAPTFYQVLGVGRGATGEEIKSAFRRMARQWHPDVCREPNAADMFMRIQEAHQILSNEMKRGRYDAGLALEASLPKSATQADWTTNVSGFGYRSPLRCGLVMCNGIQKMGRFYVEKILAWEDITRDDGKTLVASWKQGADRPTEEYV